MTERKANSIWIVVKSRSQSIFLFMIASETNISVGHNRLGRSLSWFAGTLQYQRSACDEQYLPERRSGSKIFRSGTTTPHPWPVTK